MADNPQEEIEIKNDTGTDLPVSIIGATDDTPIGNVGDRLKVDAAFTPSVTPSDKVVHFAKHLLNTGSDDMDVNGTVGSPIVFETGPPAGQIWYIFELGLSMDDNGNNTIGSFGAIPNGLTNGLIIEQQINSIDYEFETLRNNQDIVETFTDHYIRGVANAFLNSSNFFSGKIEFREAITLVGDDGDVIKATVQDNLTGMDLLHISVEGYRVI